MSVTSKFKIIVLLFISFFMVINISSAMTFTDGQTVDTTRMLESNDVWVHNIPFSGTARITVEMNVVEGEDVDFILFRNASYDEYIRNTLVQSPRELAIDRLIGYCAFSTKCARDVYSNSFSFIADGEYDVVIQNPELSTNVPHQSKVHLSIISEPLVMVNTEGSNIDETQIVEQTLYWAHSFIGGKKKSVKISVIEGGDADFYLMDEIGYEMYTDKDSNRIISKVDYKKEGNRSIAYDFTGGNEKYYIIVDNSNRLGVSTKGPIKVHFEVQEQEQEAAPGFELIIAIAGFLGVSSLLRRKK